MHWVQWGIPLVALKANVIKGHPMNEYCLQGEKGVKWLAQGHNGN